MNGHYALDKGNAKLMGVCAGFARWADADPTLTRLTMVLIAVFLGPIAILAYLATGLVANNG
jgi:phage shock protein C